ncbi:DNA recombination protein RmuC [Opitutaceae bacterium TAV5]|nr:DNA recombination protein RmuC [Opitutaceae bacterium TAV5]
MNPPFLLPIITLLLGAFAGAGAMYLFLRGRHLALHERLAAREADAARLAAELDTRSQELRQIAAERHTLASDLAGERAASEARLKSLTEAHERLAAEFKALSGDALKSNNTAFLELARETFGRLQQQSSGDLEKRQQAIDALVKPLQESLKQVDAKIGEIEKNRAASHGALAEQLKSLGTAQQQLQSETSRLSTALRSTTAAGTWGEMQLRRVVELAGMTSYCDFTTQESVTTGDAARLRPDMVVRLPGGQQIVVDAKAPNEAYRDAASSTDETLRAAKLAEHAARVRGHIDALGARAYWEQFQPSPEFVVLFLPGDQFLSGALQADPGLIERAINKKVLLATPATLIALLKAAAYGWRQEAVSRNADEISALGRQLHDRLCTFADHLERIGKGLESATKAYNSAVGSLESSVLPGARRFPELGAKGAKELRELAPVDTAPREIARKQE